MFEKYDNCVHDKSEQSNEQGSDSLNDFNYSPTMFSVKRSKDGRNLSKISATSHCDNLLKAGGLHADEHVPSKKSRCAIF